MCTDVHRLYYPSIKVSPKEPSLDLYSFLSSFLLINDIPLHMQNSNIGIYADDATLTSCSKRNNISLVNNNIQRNLGNIQRWANMNKMVINGKKTKSVLVIGKRLRKRMNKDQHQDSDFTIALNNSQIERVRTQEVEIDDDS